MARFDPQSAGLGLLAGGLVLGGMLAMATPTRMKPPPEPAWRVGAAPQPNATIDDDSNAAPWFAAQTYEVLPAIRRVPEFTGSALPPPEARFASSYADDGDWRQIDADADAVSNDADGREMLSPEDDEPAVPAADEDDGSAHRTNEGDAALPITT